MIFIIYTSRYNSLVTINNKMCFPGLGDFTRSWSQLYWGNCRHQVMNILFDNVTDITCFYCKDKSAHVARAKVRCNCGVPTGI